MRLTRVYVDAPLVPGTRITLEGSAASHVTRVLRLRTGDALTLFNGRGGEYAASIDKSQAGVVTVAIGEHRAAERESPLAITLAQGLSRGERMDLVVQKATELGVTQLQPLLTERSVVRLDAQQAHRKLNHWHAIAVAACEQSGRNRLPEVMAPATLRDFLRTGGGRAAAGGQAAPAADTLAGTRLLLSPAAAVRIDEVPRPAGGVTLLIGPEGGLAEAEQEAARTAGFILVRLGPRVLRTETAAIAALALLQRQFGDL
jgi:16S rRNA (uracil1498-N3)-methyltransferase